MDLDTQAPSVNKINKTVVTIIAAILVGGYLIFGFKNIGDKPEFNNSFDIKAGSDIPVIDAPDFVKNRTYSNIKYASVKPAAEKERAETVSEPEPEIKASPKVKPAPEIEKTTSPYITPTKVAKTAYVSQHNAVDSADLSPSGWASETTPSYTTKSNSNVDYNAMYAQLNSTVPSTDQIINGINKNGTENSREKFLNSSSQHENIYLQENIESPKSPYQIMAGSVIPCTLITGINSDLPGQIVAQVSSQVYDSVSGQHLLVPHGTTFIGSYDSGVLFGQQRCLFAWKRMKYPDGRSIQLGGMTGADLAGYSGISDSVDYHYMRLTGAVFMSAFMALGKNKLDNGTSFRSTMAEDMNKSGQKIVDMQLNVQPTLNIGPGTPFNIIVNKDMVLEPYKGRG